MDNINLGVIGCGKMAGAILGGVYNNKFLKNKNIFLYDINNDASAFLSKKYGFSKTNSVKEILDCANVILLATKPFVFAEIVREIKSNYNNQLIMSILAGVKIKKYRDVVSNIKIARIMPNTPALVNKGMSAVCFSDNISDEEAGFVYNFMLNCGRVIKTKEEKMDVITALSGSGPAYYYKIIDLAAKSAEKLGLDYNEAILLSAQTALGSAQMVLENNFDTERLIKNVTTPGGCTEAGNNVLNSSNIDEILDKTIKDTMQRAIELGNQD